MLRISCVAALAEGTPPAGAQRRPSANVLVEPKGSYVIASPIGDTCSGGRLPDLWPTAPSDSCRRRTRQHPAMNSHVRCALNTGVGCALRDNVTLCVHVDFRESTKVRLRTVLAAMHPRLSLENTPACVEQIKALQACHADTNYWIKLMGACNEKKMVLDKCFRAQKKVRGLPPDAASVRNIPAHTYAS